MGTALVTGASAGIGLELARMFAADKHNLVLVARRREKLEELAAAWTQEFGVKVTVVEADLSQAQAPQSVFAATQAAGIEVDYLVNNAGFGTNGAFWELDAQRELEQIQVNVTSLVHLTHLFLPAMVARKTGAVLNIASTAGFQGGPFMATYYATKAFVVTFTEALAVELHGTGVTATAHCPGATYSEFAKTAGTDKTRLFQRSGVATSQAVAADAYRAMLSGRPIRIHGLMNKIGVFGTRFAPRAVSAAIAAKLNRPPGE